MASTTNDKRLTAIKTEKTADIKESNSMYQSMINQSDSFYNKQIAAVKEYGDTQAINQQEQTDFAIEKIEQQQENARKDYLKEQTGAYVDWQKQSDQYGSNAEQMAASGLAHTGYSESSQVAMYNTYQNRVATARETYQRSIDNYNNSINEAILQNNSLLAEIAFNTLQTSLELSLEGFQYKNTLLESKLNAKQNLSQNYWSRYTDTLSQINTENSLAETIRSNKADEKYQKDSLAETIRSNKADEKYQKDSLAEEKRQYNLSYELEKKN